MNRSKSGAVMLLSGSPNDRSLLRSVFTGAGWTVCEGAQSPPDWKGVVICDGAPPLALRPGCELIVFSRFADDRMWSDVLDAGAFDLPGYPFDEVEMLRVASAAWRQIESRSRHGCSLAIHG